MASLFLCSRKTRGEGAVRELERREHDPYCCGTKK